MLLSILFLFFSLLKGIACTVSSEFFIDEGCFIPIQIYKPVEDKISPLVIINHGYSVKNTEYSFIAMALCEQGYLVVSVQHDLENDPKLPTTGNLFARRMPRWQRGLKTILFVLKKLKVNKKFILIGHSNGGDISMMFADKYPKLVEKAISLDSLRYPFPIKNHIPILSLRANDTNADDGVIPKNGATIVTLCNAKHIDMCDRGPEVVKEEIIRLIAKFLRGKND